MQCLEKLKGDVDIDVFLKDDTPMAPLPSKPRNGDDVLPRDARVLIYNLSSSAADALNGLEGRVSGYSAANRRYEVKLKGDGRVISCKRENLIDLGQHQV